MSNEQSAGINSPIETQNSPQVSGPQRSGVFPVPRTSSPLNDADVSPNLPQLLALLENPKFSDWWAEVAPDNQHRAQLKALADLWKSLGRPASGFWQHTYVFCTRIADEPGTDYVRQS